MSSGFRSALAFLSRLGSQGEPTGNYSPGLLWYGPVGALIGLLSCLGSFILIFLLKYGAKADSIPDFGIALAGGLAWLSLEVWISRGLHEDGLADVGDALGSGKTGADFTKILKDSRLGTFGALLLCLCLLWQWLLLCFIFMRGISQNGPLVFLLPVLACAWSRTAPLWLAFHAKASAASFLGKMLCGALSLKIFYASCVEGCLWLALSLLCGMKPFVLPLLVLAQYLLSRYLGCVARRNGGLSGDFLGAQVELSQLAFLLCASF